jgi:hypothetical protein
MASGPFECDGLRLSCELSLLPLGNNGAADEPPRTEAIRILTVKATAKGAKA